MEEYTFTPQNSEIEDVEKIEEEIIPAPKKKGSAKKFFLSLGAVALTVAVSFTSGFAGAHFLVSKRMDTIEQEYEVKFGEFLAKQDKGSILLSTDKNGNNENHIDSVIASQSVTNTAIVNAINKSNAASSYAAVASVVKDTVVEISTEMAAGSAFFQQFIQSGAGSGVIISDDGYIITNNHVIEGATKITVRLTSGNEYAAELIGADAQADVAVIKINPENKLSFAIVGNSDSLSVGEEVLAIGNPLGRLGGSVTNGIISALDRELTIDGQTMRLLQTNAAINPGNSGGGLFNMKGELVAVVNAKSSGTGIEGLGFAIPINYAYEIATELLTKGYVSGRPAIGFSYVEITNYMDLMRYGVSSYGIYVYDGGDSPLKNGDRIVSCGEYEVQDAATLRNAIQQYKVGDKVELMVVRGGKYVKLEVTLIESKPTEETKLNIE